MLLSKDFFDLNLRFAGRVSAVIGQSLQETLLEYTHLYLAFGIGRDFEEENLIWQIYLSSLSGATDQAEQTYQFYLERMARQPKHRPENPFGCFFYSLWDGDRVRLHFYTGTGQDGPLQRRNLPERMAELNSMFEHLKTTVPPVSTVVGGSWLYNIEAYRRLFPAKYLRTARGSAEEYRFLALWGQFLFHDGSVRRRMVEEFFKKIEKAKTLEELQSCFPYQVLRLESSITDFYTFYGIE